MHRQISFQPTKLSLNLNGNTWSYFIRLGEYQYIFSADHTTFLDPQLDSDYKFSSDILHSYDVNDKDAPYTNPETSSEVINTRKNSQFYRDTLSLVKTFIPHPGANDDLYRSYSSNDEDAKRNKEKYDTLINYWETYGPPYVTNDKTQYPTYFSGDLIRLASRRFLGTCFTVALLLSAWDKKLFPQNVNYDPDHLLQLLTTSPNQNDHDLLILSLWENEEIFSPLWIHCKHSVLMDKFAALKYEEEHIQSSSVQMEPLIRAIADEQFSYISSEHLKAWGIEWKTIAKRCLNVLNGDDSFFPVVVEVNSSDIFYLKQHQHSKPLLYQWLQSKFLSCILKKIDTLHARLQSRLIDGRPSFYATLDSNIVFFLLHYIEQYTDKSTCRYCGKKLIKETRRGAPSKYCKECKLKVKSISDYRKSVKDNVRHQMIYSEKHNGKLMYKRDNRKSYMALALEIDKCFNERWTKDETLKHINEKLASMR